MGNQPDENHFPLALPGPWRLCSLMEQVPAVCPRAA